MGRVSQLRRMVQTIKKFGIVGCILRVVCRMIYPPVQKFYELFVRRFCLIQDRQILFMSNPAYSDNSKTLFEYVKQTSTEYDFVWMMKRSEQIPKNFDSTCTVIWNEGVWHHRLPLRTIKAILTSKYLFLLMGLHFIMLHQERGRL